MSDYELYHYGVPGMKWGVRRAIGKQARAYARGYYADKSLVKKTVKINKKISKATQKYGESSNKVDRLKVKRSKINKARAGIKSMMKQNVKGLSKKDIEKGKRDYKTRQALALATVLTGPSIVTSQRRGENMSDTWAKRMRNRHRARYLVKR